MDVVEIIELLLTLFVVIHDRQIRPSFNCHCYVFTFISAVLLWFEYDHLWLFRGSLDEKLPQEDAIQVYALLCYFHSDKEVGNVNPSFTKTLAPAN